MTRDELLDYATELQNSLNDLPMIDDPNYHPKWNEGYRIAVLQVVRDLLRQVERMDKLSAF